VGPGLELLHIRGIHILCGEESAFGLAAAPNLLVLSPHQAFRGDGLYLMPEPLENPHQKNGDIVINVSPHSKRPPGAWPGRTARRSNKPCAKKPTASMPILGHSLPSDTRVVVKRFRNPTTVPPQIRKLVSEPKNDQGPKRLLIASGS
jgi:hypothetical protein